MVGSVVSAALLLHHNRKLFSVECAAPVKPRIERDYKSEGALSELLTTIRTTLDQAHGGTMQVESHDQVYIAVVHRDYIRIQIISKSTSQVLEFIDCEYNWMSSDITKADFCRVYANEKTNNVLVEIDNYDAFDIIYRSVVRMSVDIASNKCKITRK